MVKGKANISPKIKKGFIKLQSSAIKEKFGVDHRGLNSMVKKLTRMRRAAMR